MCSSVHVCTQQLGGPRRLTGTLRKSTTRGLEELIPQCFEQVRLWHLWRRSVHWFFPAALLRMTLCVLGFQRGTGFMFAARSNMGSHPRKLCVLLRHPPHIVHQAVRLIDGQVAKTAPHEICPRPVPGPPREESCGRQHCGRGGEWPHWLATNLFRTSTYPRMKSGCRANR